MVSDALGEIDSYCAEEDTAFYKACAEFSARENNDTELGAKGLDGPGTV